MEKILEFVDTWMKSQKDFMEGWVKSQKEFMDNWTVATKIIHDSLLNMGKSPEGTAKEVVDLYQSALMSMVDSSKVLTDEAGKVQETWKNTVAKQMDMSREMVKTYAAIFNKAA
jgi:hypothetical protein